MSSSPLTFSAPPRPSRLAGIGGNLNVPGLPMTDSSDDDLPPGLSACRKQRGCEGEGSSKASPPMCGDENSSGKEGRHLLRGGSIRRHGSTQVVLSDSDEAQEAPQRPGTGESAGAQAKHCDGHRVRPRRSSTRLQGLPRRLSSHLLASRRRSSMHQLISSSDDEESTAEERSGSEMGEGEGSCAAKWPVGSCVAGRWSSDGEWYPAKVISVSPLGAIELRFDDDTVQTTDAADVAGPEVMRCFSRNDEITDEELKDAHVCWSSPDGSCRMCFNLSTLRKVALSVGQPMVWKQPPHFRQPMEAGLRKQIACRFGGQKALCLSHESLGSRDFEVLFNNWARKRMGSAELHACPICYTWIVEDLRGTIDEDPLTVLTSSSSGEPGAAHIAFRVKKHVVAHLKERHGIPASIREHGDILERFAVRKADGLLQRWLHDQGFNNPKVMLSYWLDGNSQTMLAIHDIAGRVAAGIPIDAEQPFEERRYMSMSLPTWQQLTQDSDIDFVVSDGDDEDGGEASYGTEESCEDPTQLLRMLSEKKRRRMVGNRDREYSSSGPDHCEDALSDDEIVYDSEPDALDLAKNPRLRQTKRSEKGQGGRLKRKADRCPGNSTSDSDLEMPLTSLASKHNLEAELSQAECSLMDDCDNDGLPDNPSGAPSLKRRKTAAIVSESDDERRAECHMPEEENDDNRSNSSLMEVQPGSRRRSRCIKGRFRAAQRRQAENRRMRHAVPGMRTMDMPDESQSDSE